MDAAAKQLPRPSAPGRARAYQMLAALVLGVAAGLLLRRFGAHGTSIAHNLGQLGQLWLNALQMTLIPLIFCLMTAGVASIAGTASGGAVARVSVSIFLGLLVIGSILGTLTALGLIALWPLAQFPSAAPAASAATPSLLTEFVSLVPSNPIASAAQGFIAPVIVFAAVLGAAIARIKARWSTLLLDVFDGLAAALLLIIDWVLRFAPAGIFFLLLATVTSAGSEAAKGLLQYAVLGSLVALVGVVAAEFLGLVSGVGARRFARAALPSQMLAATTQSSSACLPPLLEAGTALQLPPAIVNTITPLAVAIFRFGNVVVGVASGLIGGALFGVHPTAGRIVIAISIGILTNIGSVGVPGAAVLLASWGPIYLALGVPIEAITLFIAIITLPDMLITTANVTCDLAATSLITTLLRKRLQPVAEPV